MTYAIEFSRAEAYGARSLLHKVSMQLRRAALILASIPLLVSCSSDKGTGPGDLEGLLEFLFSGMTSGSFSAQGSLTSTTNPSTTASWAAGYRDEQEGALVVEAVKPQSGGTYDLVAITIPRLTTGSSTIDINCTTSCAAVIVLFRQNDSTQDFQFLCGLESGTLTISSISSTRAAGTFSGSGTCFDASFTQGSFSVTGGTFDVVLVSSIG